MSAFSSFYKNPFTFTVWIDNLQASSLSQEAPGRRNLALRARVGFT